MTNICRFCKGWEGHMVKYGPRHHAHAGCLIDRKGVTILNSLQSWQLRNIPWLTLKNRGISYEQMKSIISARENNEHCVSL